MTRKITTTLAAAAMATTLAVAPAQARPEPLPEPAPAVIVDDVELVASRGSCGWWFPFLWYRLYLGATGRCY